MNLNKKAYSLPYLGTTSTPRIIYKLTHRCLTGEGMGETQ